MGLDNLLATLEKRDYVTPVTPVTPETTPDVTPKPAWIKDCTSVTPVTPQNDVTADETANEEETPREARRQKVIAMLGDGRKFAVLVENPDDDQVVCAVAIRGLASFELAIPRKYYDGMAMLEIIEECSGTEISTTTAKEGNEK